MFKKLIIAAAALFSATAFAGAGALAADADASSVVQAGKFEGRSDHVTTGGVSILKTDSGYVAVLEADFSLDGAPTPTLGFGKDGEFEKKTQFTKLNSKQGLQVYAIPAEIDPSQFDEFYVWCSRFGIPLGVADIAVHNQ